MDRTNGAGHVNHLFVAENAATNQPPTEITTDWLNGIQEELIAILLAGGIVPDKVNLSQLLTALRSAGVFQTAAQFDNTTKAATTEFVQKALSQAPISFRNKIINGARQVDQINNGVAVTPSAIGNTYVSDQWAISQSVGLKLTFQQVIDAPAGFKYSTKITVAASYAPLASDYFNFYQPIEGQNIVDFQLGTNGAVTLGTSNYIKGSVPGIYAVSVTNGANNRSYVGTINVTNTWSRVVITLVGDTAGVWATDNTVGMHWRLDLGSGTSFNTAANAWQAGLFFRTAATTTFVNQAVGATLNVTGNQIEKISAGATAVTDFEHVDPDLQLFKCCRYVQVLPATGYLVASGVWVSPLLAFITYPFITPMRSFPTEVILGTGSSLVSSGTWASNSPNGIYHGGTAASGSLYLGIPPGVLNGVAGQATGLGCSITTLSQMV